MSFDRNQFDLFTFLLGKISGAFADVTVAETENMDRSCDVQFTRLACSISLLHYHVIIPTYAIKNLQLVHTGLSWQAQQSEWSSCGAILGGRLCLPSRVAALRWIVLHSLYFVCVFLKEFFALHC